MIPKSESHLTLITRTRDHPHRRHTTTEAVDAVGLGDITLVGFDLDRPDVIGGIITMDTLDPHTVSV
jgi:hypothetical protein